MERDRYEMDTGTNSLGTKLLDESRPIDFEQLRLQPERVQMP
jgi:hypothetical protein